MRLTTFRRLEFWTITTLFSLIVSSLIYDKYSHANHILQALSQPMFQSELQRITAKYDWNTNGLFPILVLASAIYLAWLLISQWLLPHYKTLGQKKVILYASGIILLIMMAVIYFLSTWKDIDFRYWVDWCVENNRYWRENSIIGAKVRSPFRWLNVFLFSSNILSKLSLYTLLSYSYQWAVRQDFENNINAKILKEGSILATIILAFHLWMNLPNGYPPATIYLFPFAAFAHAYLFHKNLFKSPESTERQLFKKDWIKFIITIFIVAAIVGLISYIDYNTLYRKYQRDYGFGYSIYSFLNIDRIMQNVITILFLSFVATVLRTLAVRPWQIQFGRKQAELAGLQAQINPHFLFNALNTLYATSINEDAPKTSDGIQKLSDMMRFMLHENHQTKIDIRQEVTYLKNYIDLQQLRIAGLKDFELKTNLDDTLCLHSIAPMLLIPFVENAFKHGVSMRQKSWITVNLHCDGKKLYFSVFNSLHPQSAKDPEKKSSGIGLENVKKRLQLLYPKRHQLTIHQTDREFSVKLEVQAS